MVKIDLREYRILILAIFVSLVWHLFWLSTIKIVAAPGGRNTVKFSRVSFLGPILMKGATDVRVAPQERSFLESRYMANITRELLPIPRLAMPQPAYFEPGPKFDRRLTPAIGEAMIGSKLEPTSATE